MKKILFVCTGNTCRSPMAEALLKSKSNHEVKSAGVFASPGIPASSQTIEVLKENKIDCEHQSSPLTNELVDWADLILTMTANHKHAVLQNFPESTNKVYVLKEYTDDSKETATYDISDPFGGSLDIYRQAYKEIENGIDQLIKKL